MFFRDGKRRVDFVLSYVDDKDGERKQVRSDFLVLYIYVIYSELIDCKQTVVITSGLVHCCFSCVSITAK